MLKIIDNRDTDLLEIAKQQLQEQREKYGKAYCPCSFIKSQDWVCPCKKFREQAEPGECNCGRYEKIEAGGH